MIPLPNIPLPDELPPQCNGLMKNLKWSIVAMIVFGIGRAIFAFLQSAISMDFFALIQLFLSITMGTFMFKDDEHLHPVYECLTKSICQMFAEQGSGLQCLMPFMMITCVNVVFDTLTRHQLFGVMPYGFFLMASLVAQGVAVYFAYQVFKVLRGAPAGGNYEMSGGGGGWGGGGGYSRPDAGAPPQQDFDDGRPERTSQPQPATGFVPFAGSGNRLGN
uniref:Uncharacterized protein n=1 Tax=Zooxanthella nutricula TaxID=1333877 RepID=A0A6U6UQC5_9DINO|mmetsp:Transcript_85605/g.261873  ORF Transcript_85605/g.261873 Transcript_85605/m.261873 type:complete len:219 (+) Transcript_85605:83-739(+)